MNDNARETLKKLMPLANAKPSSSFLDWVKRGYIWGVCENLEGRLRESDIPETLDARLINWPDYLTYEENAHEGTLVVTPALLGKYTPSDFTTLSNETLKTTLKNILEVARERRITLNSDGFLLGYAILSSFICLEGKGDPEIQTCLKNISQPEMILVYENNGLPCLLAVG